MAKDKELQPLSNKQKAFGREYVFDWNGKEAAIRAGYSAKTAKEQASRLLTNVNLQEYIADIQKDIAKLAGISQLSQIRELQKIAYSNIADLFQDWVKLSDFEDLTPEQKGAILEISYKKDKKYIDGMPTDIETEFVKLKMHDKHRAIQEINKMLGFYAPEKTDITSGGEKIKQQPTTVTFINARKDKEDKE